MTFSIFLDVDGVLFEGLKAISNSPKFKRLLKQSQDPLPKVYSPVRENYRSLQVQTHFFDPAAIHNLREVFQAIALQNEQLNIILSSNWRKYFSPHLLKDLFKILFFSKYIGDKIWDKVTVEISGVIYALSRPECIELYLKQHPEITRFLILDDSFPEEFQALFPRNFVHCKNLFSITEKEYALMLLKDMFSQETPDLPGISETLYPIAVKTCDMNTRCNQTLGNISMRVLSTRLGFLANRLQRYADSPFRETDNPYLKDNDPIVNLIKDYAADCTP